MNKEQIKGLLQSFLIRVNKVNLPLALNDYSDILNNLFNEKNENITDLEAKLAEHNEFFNTLGCKDFNEFQDFISTFMLTPHEEQTLIKELKQQLEEKDRLIEYFKKQAKRFNNEAQKYFEDAYCNDAAYQDKISFATQNFEDLRNEITANSHYFKVDTEFYKYVYETIGEKIKRLKKGV